jgi:hypothetical protein
MKNKLRRSIPSPTVIATKLPDTEELSRIADTARRDGFITINDLVCVLSSDHSYTDRLPECWHEFQLNIRISFPNDISTSESRVRVWIGLFKRWTIKTVACSTGGLNVIRGLPGYIYDTQKDELVKVKGSECDPDYVKLDELKSYFTDYLKLPLPILLFPTDKEQSKKSTARPSKNQLLKDKVRAAAEKLWKKDPSITKAAMAFHDVINSIPGASEMNEGTLKRWIKDLNPNRLPGRRPEQT